MTFHSAGEKRKFYRNMRENVSARQIGVAGFSLLTLLGPIALIMMAVFAIYNGGFHIGSSHVSGVLAAAAAPVVPLTNIKMLRQKDSDLLAEGRKILSDSKDRGLTAEERTRLDAITTDRKALGEDITRVEAFLADERLLAAGGAGARVHNNAEDKPWANLGEQLQAIRKHFMGGGTDPRIMAAALGGNEGTPAEGGILIDPQFAPGLLERTYDVAVLAGLCAEMEVSTNRVVLKAVDEDSRADGSRWGGIQAYWDAEAGTYTATKPKFRDMELIPKKLIGLTYATEEQLEDSTAFASFINRAFPNEFAFKIDDSILNGSGAGQPLGVLNGGAKVTVSAEGGQSSGTIVTNNVLKMWARLFSTSRRTAVWLVNQDTEPQLYPLTLGTGTAVQLLYTPPGVMGNAGPYGLLMGRPVIPVEQAATLGTEGDIMLCDFQQYLLAKKSGGMRADTSIHVQFLTGEQAFRFMLRLDGQPTWKKPLTPKNGSNTLSPFITLASR